MSASSEEQQGAAMSPVGGEADPSSAGVVRVVVRRREYHDPVTLMEASEAARSVAGVVHVAVAMAEPLNMLILGQRHGYEVGADGLGADDVVIALRASDEAAADEALAVIEGWLDEHGAARRVIDVGPYVFAGGEAVERMRFRVAEAGGDDALPAGLAARAEAIARANDEAVGRMQEARPLVVGVATAADVLPGMGPRTFLHAGPPIEWADMSGPLRGAIIGAALLEGVADDPDDAVRRAQAGEFEFAPGHERGALGPMAGVIGPSMPVWVVENETHGNRAHCTFSEALAGFRFGRFGPEVVERLRWLRGVLGPVVRSTLGRLPAPLDLRAITAQAVQMGDEVHNLNRAGTAEVFRALAPAFMEVDAPSNDVSDVARYIAEDLFFYLNLSMASGKATADAASGIEDSTIVTTIARNGTEVGVRMSGTGERWFTAPSSTVRGLYFPGYRREDANPDLGDSTITETIGLGGFVMAAAPAIGHIAGITAEDALRATLSMYEITWAESTNYRIPALGFRGTPVGIDCRKVVSTGIVPIANTGIAHRRPGVGVIGRGIVSAPIAPFVGAVHALGQQGSI